MKIQLKQIEFVELEILKNEVYAFVNHQKTMIDNGTDDTDKYNRFVFFGVGRDLYFSFGNRMISNLKSHGKTHCTFSVSVAEAALLQFVCCFNTSNKNEYEKHTLERISRLIDQQIKSII